MQRLHSIPASTSKNSSLMMHRMQYVFSNFSMNFKLAQSNALIN